MTKKEERRSGKNPLTREHVLKRIEEHGEPESLNLSEENLVDIDLSGIDLSGANLKKAHLNGANLQGAKLQGAILRNANLQGANLQGANLRNAKLQGANFNFCNLSEVILCGAEISRDTRLEDAVWGLKYIVGDENDFLTSVFAEDVYRRLKQWYTEAGIYGKAGEFHYREIDMQRKAAKWWWARPIKWRKRYYWVDSLRRLQLELYRFLCGYGERPSWVVVWATVVVFGLAAIYIASGLTFLASLYHSVVSFTALGYGLGVSDLEGWVKGLGAGEAVIGVFMMALFLVTFFRKMTR